ncbi:MAG: outer membrane beta-barrel protein [Fermentimonas sp.]|nr:outer membrane beta-barrel protein [Fermentimonas sp.]
MLRLIQFFLIGLLVFTIQFRQSNLNAQSNFSDSKGAIGITYSGLGDNFSYYFQDVIGGGSYSGRGYNSFGATYIRPLTKSLEIETGLSYSKYIYEFSNASLGPDAPEPYEITNAVIDIPVTVRWTFLKYFFLNGGLLLGIDAEKENHLDDQTGIGASIGVGAKYDFKNIPVGLFVNPYYKIHSLIPFSTDKYHLRTDESGFRFGIVYYL